jgi:hypothetical protein
VATWYAHVLGEEGVVALYVVHEIVDALARQSIYPLLPVDRFSYVQREHSAEGEQL